LKNHQQQNRFVFIFRKPDEQTMWLQEKQDEYGQGKWEEKQKIKSDKRIMESEARQKEALHLCTKLAN
jgi:hypothetical protein